MHMLTAFKNFVLCQNRQYKTQYTKRCLGREVIVIKP